MLKTPETEWIEQFEVCQNASAYEVITAHTAKQCKSACTKDQKCSMVKYHSKDSKCWKSSSLKMQHSGIECAVKYDFYQKGVYFYHLLHYFQMPTTEGINRSWFLQTDEFRSLFSTHSR